MPTTLKGGIFDGVVIATSPEEFLAMCQEEGPRFGDQHPRDFRLPRTETQEDC